MYKYHIIFAIVLALCSACEKSVDVQLPPHTPQIVVNARLSAGDSLQVYISRSYGPLEDVTVEDIILPDARVEVFDNEQSLGVLAYRDTLIDDFFGREIVLGKHVHQNHIVQANHTYRIKVSHPDYETVTAETTVPNPMDIENVEIIQNAFRKVYADGYAEYQSLLRITLNDPVDIENFYSLGNEMIVAYQNNMQPPLFMEYVYIEGVAKEAGDGGYETTGKFANDDAFDGTTATIDYLCYLPNSNLIPTEIYEYEFTEIEITTFSANADWSKYIEKVQLQRESNIDDIGLFPSESVVVYSNIENGYGIFGGVAQKKEQIQL